ncbi:MAG: alpha/beta fold hydrolase [Pseudomonadota bacterium]
MPSVRSNGITIEYEVSGPVKGPAVLMVMGLGQQLVMWPTMLVDGLNAAGFRTIRIDNRDVGKSTKVHGKSALPPALALIAARVGVKGLAPYLLPDMAKDAVGVLDALDVDRAHIMGVSMGGMIGQIISADYPDRVKSFTALLTTTNKTSLPRPSAEVVRTMTKRPSKTASRDQIIDHALSVWDVIGTKDPDDPRTELRARVAEAVDRCVYPAGLRRQIAAILATGELGGWTDRIAASTLIIHGSDDPLVHVDGAKDIAARVQDSQLAVIDGMGHDLPAKHLPHITELVVAHLRAADERASANAAA